MVGLLHTLSIPGYFGSGLCILLKPSLSLSRPHHAFSSTHTHRSEKLMSFFLSMLPIYMTGNFHCLGMCGPLVMTIAHHPYRFLYFFGRTLSFTLLGLISATFGMAIEISLKNSGFSAIACFLLGSFMLLFALGPLISPHIKLPRSIGKRLAKQTSFLSLLLLRNRPLATFYFGFFTPLLPCGQTLMVFSALALYGNPLGGMINGFFFALITSPSLIFAMKAVTLFTPKARMMRFVLPLATLPPAILAFLRGFAEMDIIEHASIVLPNKIHLILY